jgi:hypothetical protein
MIVKNNCKIVPFALRQYLDERKLKLLDSGDIFGTKFGVLCGATTSKVQAIDASIAVVVANKQ